MKLIVAIVASDDAGDLIDCLVKDKITVTRLATSGGFLKRRNVTLLIGVGEKDVGFVLDIIKKRCKARVESVPVTSRCADGGVMEGPCAAIPIGGATVFVLNVEESHRM